MFSSVGSRFSALCLLLSLGCTSRSPAPEQVAVPSRVTVAAREPIGCFPSATDRDGFPAAEANVPGYALAISGPDRHRLEDPFAPADLSVPGTFTAGGRSWAVHISTHSLRTGSPRSWDVRFPAEDRFDCGRERVELVSHGAGRLKLGADLAAAVGAPAPSARIVELTVNGEKLGAYTELESVARRGLPRGARLRPPERDLPLRSRPLRPDRRHRRLARRGRAARLPRRARERPGGEVHRLGGGEPRPRRLPRVARARARLRARRRPRRARLRPRGGEGELRSARAELRAAPGAARRIRRPALRPQPRRDAGDLRPRSRCSGSPSSASEWRR